MTSTKSENYARKRTARGVRAPYTFAQLKNDLQGAYRPKDRQNSLRAISKKYGVSHAAVQRVLAGIEPHDPKIRVAFGLPELRPAPVCPKHGVVHAGQCPRAARVPKDLWDWPVKALRDAIRNRK
jgi:hypothetical protein